MLRPCFAAALILVLLVVAMSKPRFHSEAVQENSTASGHFPVDLRMDRNDVANISKTHVSSIAPALVLHSEIRKAAIARIGEPTPLTKPHTPITKQQHVFRI
jgi:hypothetical protein